MEWVLAVDIGTSSIKAALIDYKGKFYHNFRLFFSKNVTAGEWVSSFYNIFKQVVDVLSNLNAGKLLGICISGNGPSLVLVGKGHPDILFMWNEIIDTSSIDCGDSVFIPRILGLRKKYPPEFSTASLILSGPEYLIYKLTGNAVTILPEKRFLGAYWSDDLLSNYGISDEILPHFVNSGKCVGKYRDINVYCGAPDFISALIGTNTLSVGSGCDRAGTSEGLNICIGNEPIDTKLNVIRKLPSVVFPFWNVSYLISNTGKKFLQYLNDIDKSFLDFNDILSKILELPILGDNNSNIGFGKKTVESIGFEVRHAMDMLTKLTGFTPDYVLSGGQAENDVWCKLKSDITGYRLVITQTPNAELLGNAILAFTEIGMYRNIAVGADSMVKYVKVYEPNRLKYNMYSEIYNNDNWITDETNI